MSISNVDNGKMCDVEIEPGRNFRQADFKLWIPDNLQRLRGILVVISGSNSDSRPFLEQASWMEFVEKYRQRFELEVRASVWQDSARRHGFGLMGCLFKDRLHDNMFIEEYCDVKQGSGQALLDALTEFSQLSGHPEIEGAPLVFWGMSAGGQFGYEFACWRPERVVTFIVNKGGTYYTALAPEATRRIPCLIFMGERDIDFRKNILRGIFSLNRRAGALWSFIEEPDATHEVRRSIEVSEAFYDEVIPLRLPDSSQSTEGAVTLRDLDLKDGLLGDLEELTYGPYDQVQAAKKPMAWLLNEKVALTWKAMARG